MRHPLWHLIVFCLQPFVYYQVMKPERITTSAGVSCKDGCSMGRLQKRDVWPKGIHQLLPHGPVGTVRGIVQWLTLNPCVERRFYFDVALQVLVYVCYPVVFPFISSYGPVFYLAVMKGMAMNGAVFVTMKLEDITFPMKRFATSIQLATLINRYSTLAERHTFWTTNPRRALKTCLDALEVFVTRIPTRPSWLLSMNPEVPEMLRGLIKQLCIDIPLLSSSLAMTPYRQLADMSGSALKWYHFEQMVCTLRYSQRCANYRCSETMASRKVKRCGGCMITL
jgi:hypothetical protein